jgi:membrane protease YdiL (CAAX protease family)
MTYLAEILPNSKPFWEYGNLPPEAASAGFFFLILLCSGLAVDLGMVLHAVKRPPKIRAWRQALTDRALPWQMVLLLVAALVGFYLFASLSYSVLFPAGGIEPHTVLFQTLVFHLPLLGVCGLLFHFAGIQGRELFGLHWRRAPAMLRLAALYYLAALPPLWLLSALGQLVLHRLGHEFYMQDVTQVLMAPASWPVRGSLFFIAVVIAPVFEEIFFRGILLPFLVRRIGLTAGILLVSAAFAGLHWHLPSLLPLFLLSAAFSLAYARTQSLLVPIGMHAVFNGVTVALLLMIG